MRYLILLSLSFFSLCSFGQTINDIPVEEINSTYIEIVGQAKFMSTKVNISVEFGQQSKLFSAKDHVILDSDGRRVSFNSMIDALNFFDSIGYEFVSSYLVTVQGQNVYHYLMRRKE